MSDAGLVRSTQFTWIERVRDSLAFAQASLASGNTTQASSVAEMLDTECAAAGNLHFGLRARVVRALALQALCDFESAAEVLLKRTSSRGTGRRPPASSSKQDSPCSAC